MQGKVFEAYLQSEKLRTFTLEDGHTTENARFEVTVTLADVGPETTEINSRSEEPEARISKQFADSEVAAFDLKDANDPITTTMGAFYTEKGKGRTTLVEWIQFTPKSIWKDGRDIGAWRKRPVYFFGSDQPKGEYADQKMRTWSKAWVYAYPPPYDYEWSHYEYSRPYWEDNPELSTLYLPADKSGNLKTPVYKSGEDYWKAFHECSLDGSGDKTSLTADLYLEQRSGETYTGQYVARVLGVRYGGAFFVSYPGKSTIEVGGEEVPIPFFEGNKVEVPGSSEEIPERAMDLDDTKGMAQMSTLPADWKVTLNSSTEDYSPLAFASDTAGIASAIPGGQQPFFAFASAFFAAIDKEIDVSETGELEGRLRGWWQMSGPGIDDEDDDPDDIDTGWPDNVSDAEAGISQTDVSVSWTQTMDVGQQLSVWVELKCQGQLRADDTYWWPGYSHYLDGTVEAIFSGDNSCNKIKVNCQNND